MVAEKGIHVFSLGEVISKTGSGLPAVHNEGEEPIVLEAFESVKKKIPNLKLILAPRDGHNPLEDGGAEPCLTDGFPGWKKK